MSTDSGGKSDASVCNYRFDNLPDVILLKIFRYLYIGDLCRAGRVCLRWYHLTRSPVLWKHVDAHDMQLTSYQVQKFVPMLPPCVTYLRICSLSIQQRIPFLTPQVAIEIRERCPRLHTLIIESAFVAKHVHFTDITVEDLPQKLAVLSLRKSFFHTDQFFCSVSHPTVPKLKVIDCSSCWCVTDDDIPFFTRLSDLQEIYLAGCPITDEGVKILLKTVENLKVLDLEATAVGDQTVALLAEHCKVLEKLFLGRTNVTDDQLCLLPRHCLPKLQIICLARTSVSEIGLRSLILTLHNLKYLDVRTCHIAPESALELTYLVPVKRKFHLKHSEELFTAEYCDHFLKRTD